jgi:hypothetical protein
MMVFSGVASQCVEERGAMPAGMLGPRLTRESSHPQLPHVTNRHTVEPGGRVADLRIIDIAENGGFTLRFLAI